jgi:hypothetical protein
MIMYIVCRMIIIDQRRNHLMTSIGFSSVSEYVISSEFRVSTLISFPSRSSASAESLPDRRF